MTIAAPAGALVPGIRQHTPEWLALKDQAISATDAAIIAGEKGSVLELAAIKLGLVEPPEPDEETRLLWDDGLAMQPFLLDAYRRRTGRRVQAIHGIRQRKDWPVAICSPDGSVIGEPGRGLELKMSSSPKWPEAIATGEQVPGDVRAQVQWQMYVVGWEVVDVVVLLYGRPKVIPVERDDRYIDDEVYLARHFWQEHEAGVLPTADGSENARRVLARMHPSNNGLMLPRSGALDDLAAQLFDARAQAAAAAATQGSVENAVRAVIGDADGFEGDWGRITWRKNRDSERTDVKAIAQVYERSVDNLVRELRKHVPELELEGMDVSTDEGLAQVHAALRSLYTRIQEGPRVLRPQFKGQAAQEEVPA